MKKRKILSLIVAMLMVMSSCLPALAVTSSTGLEYDDSTTDNYVTSSDTVTISNILTNAENLSFATYQVLKASYDASNNTISYVLTDWAKDALVDYSSTEWTPLYNDEASALEAILSLTDLTTTSVNHSGSGTTEQNDIVNALAAYTLLDATVLGNAGCVAASEYNGTEFGFGWNYTAPATEANATLAVGSYLVIPSASNMSFLNTLVSVNAKSAGASGNQWTTEAKGAVLKGTEVSITKQVKEENETTYAESTDAQIGETVTYKLTVLVPQFDSSIADTDITFKIVDEPEHVSIIQNSVVVILLILRRKRRS